MENKDIRVLIANSTRALRDWLYDLIRELPGVKITADVWEEAAIVPIMERTDSDCVIVSLSDPDDPMSICGEIFEKRPHVRIVAIGEGTNIVAVYWRSEQGEVRCTYTTASRENILQAIRFPTV